MRLEEYISEAISSGKYKSFDSPIDSINTDMSMTDIYKILMSSNAKFYDNKAELEHPIFVDLMQKSVRRNEVSWCCGTFDTRTICVCIPKEYFAFVIRFYQDMNADRSDRSNRRRSSGIESFKVYTYKPGMDKLEDSYDDNKDSNEKNTEKLKRMLSRWI